MKRNQTHQTEHPFNNHHSSQMHSTGKNRKCRDDESKTRARAEDAYLAKAVVDYQGLGIHTMEKGYTSKVCSPTEKEWIGDTTRFKAHSALVHISRPKSL